MRKAIRSCASRTRRGLRIAFLTLSVLLIYPLWMVYVFLGVRFLLVAEALAVLTTAVLYILACDPLPPCEGKVWEWGRSLAPARQAEVPSAARPD